MKPRGSRRDYIDFAATLGGDEYTCTEATGPSLYVLQPGTVLALQSIPLNSTEQEKRRVRINRWDQKGELVNYDNRHMVPRATDLIHHLKASEPTKVRKPGGGPSIVAQGRLTDILVVPRTEVKCWYCR